MSKLPGARSLGKFDWALKDEFPLKGQISVPRGNDLDWNDHANHDGRMIFKENFFILVATVNGPTVRPSHSTS